jgi:cytochrome o ubiquinol oxidase subunit IV
MSDHDDAHAEGGHDHGSYRGYLTGFASSAVLTIIPFALVMTRALPPAATVAVVMGLAAVQILVQVVLFLHLHPRSEGGWNLLAALFTLVILGIVISGSLWVMHHLNTNMMPDHTMESVL